MVAFNTIAGFNQDTQLRLYAKGERNITFMEGYYGDNVCMLIDQTKLKCLGEPNTRISDQIATSNISNITKII